MKQPFLWVLIVCLCWTPSTLTAQQTGSIEGVVLDEATEAPIADVSVVLIATQPNFLFGDILHGTLFCDNFVTFMVYFRLSRVTRFTEMSLNKNVTNWRSNEEVFPTRCYMSIVE